MSDNGGYAGLTPSPSDVNSCDSSGEFSLQAHAAQDSPASSVTRPSNGRVLVPQHSTDLCPRGLVTKVSSPQNESGPSVGGPTGRLYTIPPRPKPGRKPATDEPASKRKAQNRESQRAFRARKAAKVQELTEQVEQVELAHRNALNEQIAEKDKLQNELRELRELYANVCRERDYWKEHFHHLKESVATGETKEQLPSLVNEQQMLFVGPLEDSRRDSPRSPVDSSHAYATPKTNDILGCNGCSPDDCACIKEIANDIAFQSQLLTPMEAVPLSRGDGSSPMTGVETAKDQSDHQRGFEEQEIDFTAKFSRTTNRVAQQPNALLSINDDPSKNQDCGWCEGHPELCLCKDASIRPDGPNEMAPAEIMEDVRASPVTNGPGSCDDCQRNPKQRAWCQRIAQLRNEATPPLSRRNSGTSVASPTSRRNSGTIRRPSWSRHNPSRGVALSATEPNTETHNNPNNPCSPPTVRERSIGCSEAFKLLDGRVPVDDDDNMDWRHLKPITPPSHPLATRRDIFTMEPGMYSAMELDASSILTTLQHARHPLTPRPSDGSHASLIRMAEERRRQGGAASHSPTAHATPESHLHPVTTPFSMRE